MGQVIIQTVSEVVPQCYAYTLPGVPDHVGWTKIGYTERDVETRIKEQTQTAGLVPKICWSMRAAYMTSPYGNFTDKDFHAYLEKLGVLRKKNLEWFQINPKDAEHKFIDFATNHGVLSTDEGDLVCSYVLREEQENAVDKTFRYFKNHEKGEFLWNAKPRFGKTLSSYELCKRLSAQFVLVVTNRPAIVRSWYDDYVRFLGLSSGYRFVSHVEGIQGEKYVLSREDYLKHLDDDVKGCIEFVSLQDLKGSIHFGGQYDKLEEVKDTKWDLLIIDEAHEGVDTYKTDTAFEEIDRKWTLHLSGTPFKALANEKFPDEAIYNWTYADEQRKKNEWDVSSEIENPYEVLPRLSLFTYKMSDVVREKVKAGIDLGSDEVVEYAFDLNEFFAVDSQGKFVHDADVDLFLDALTTQKKFPFSTPELRDELKHTFWMLNYVASAKALARKLKEHPVFADYEIILAAGNGKLDNNEESETSLNKVRKAIKEYDKTITISVGQLTTGVTIPEWTAVLMLSNMSSPALYMQAAFRAQNPYIFTGKGDKVYRKENAYVFDFDPARTLTIFEKFANDLIPQTSGDKGSVDERKEQVRELLNFFPVYSEDDEGEMIELDAEKVMTIPRRIHAKEVVDRGFMSNFLFANMTNLFHAPKEVIDIIGKIKPVKKSDALNYENVKKVPLNENNEVEIPEENLIETETELFGDKVYRYIGDKFEKMTSELLSENEKNPTEEDIKLENLQKIFSESLTDTFMEKTEEKYASSLKSSTKKKLKRYIQQTSDKVVNREFGKYVIEKNKLKKEKKEELDELENSEDFVNKKQIQAHKAQVEEKYSKKIVEAKNHLVKRIKDTMVNDQVVKKAAKIVVNVIKTEQVTKQKDEIQDGMRDHLRGFARTIPSFLMAYGDEHTTLATFDSLVPAEVFQEVTEVLENKKGKENKNYLTLDEFRMLRDGCDYYDRDEEGNEIKDEAHKHHFNGHVFDEVVFNDSVAEFMNRRKKLANYFDEKQDGDIFDYIPPQRTNQIFTPRHVVKKMVDMLEEENPGCFDDPASTFADLYMKSGMYITEIVSRLYRSSKMKVLYPDNQERLNHIFGLQVYGCAPTRIIYLICKRYILGFSDDIAIKNHHIVEFDTLPSAKRGTLSKDLDDVFGMK